MSKDSRMGGKYTGSHTTCIPLAARVCDIAVALPLVTKVSLGFINMAVGNTLGGRRVKITWDGDKCLLLTVRDNGSRQELRVYVAERQQGIEAVARKLRDHNIAICFK